jgi:23S rRNA pseudouridine1911/1915/1917 synthase
MAKPPGQFTQGTWAPPGEMTLEAALRQYLRPDDPSSVYLGIVHRLDRPTSGVLLWAKSAKAARRLSAQFEKRSVIKEYCGVVELKDWATRAKFDRGSGAAPAPNELADPLTWSDWLTRPDESGLVSAVAPGTPGARRAVTRWRFDTAETVPPGCAWIRLWPETGRTHQLRIQAARRGMPVVGDSAYGSTRLFPVGEGIALHARSLRFVHPATGDQITVAAPVPPSWAEGGLIAAE